MRLRFLFMFLLTLAVGAAALAGPGYRHDDARSSRLAEDLYSNNAGDRASLGPGGRWDDESGDESGDESDDEMDDETACAVSAASMRRSCSFEVQEEFHASMASCINFLDPLERGACTDAATLALEEDAEGCFDQEEARLDVCELLDENVYDPDPLTDDSLGFIDPNDIGDSELPNPYFSLEAGHTYVLRAGEDFEETIVVTVTEDVREYLGVDCRLVVDIVVLLEDGEYEAVEATDDFYAQAGNGDVYYCGEVSRNFEDGQLDNLDGSFAAGIGFAKSGILTRASPSAGDAHRQEWLLGEAEDVIRYVGVAQAPSAAEGGENPVPEFDCAMNGGCVKTEEFIPPEPESGEFKYFLSGVGFVLGVSLEDGVPDGERDELLCVGGSLDVLDEAACGIADPDALREELCRLSDAFCED